MSSLDFFFMKNLRPSSIVALLILITLYFSGCDFGRYFPPTNPSLGTLTAKMNGNNWNKTYKNAYQVIQCALVSQSTVFPCKNREMDIISELYSQEGYLRQQLCFIKIPRYIGRHKIVPAVSQHCNELDPVYGELFTLNQDGDVLGDVYNTLESADNFIQIDQFNEKTGEINGIFQLTLVIERRGDESRLPDTLRFTEGKFHTKILDLY
jgi:hypothetical protein